MNIYNWIEQEEKKSICQYLNSREIIPFNDWIIDSAHFNRETPEVIKVGYSIWSKPILRLIKKNKKFEKIVSKPAKWMIEELKFKKGITNKNNIKGLLFRKIVFNPISWFLGNLKLLVSKQANRSKPTLKNVIFYFLGTSK